MWQLAVNGHYALLPPQAFSFYQGRATRQPLLNMSFENFCEGLGTEVIQCLSRYALNKAARSIPYGKSKAATDKERM